MKDIEQKAEELMGCLERSKTDIKKADALKDAFKDELDNGTYVFGGVVIEIRSQVSTRLDKEALCKFFNCTVADLEQFMVTTECRQLTAKRAMSKAS